MRKITKEACEAFMQGETYKKSNTEVKRRGSDHLYMMGMELFGNLIATRAKNYPNQLTVSGGGYPLSNTTRERLNGLPNVHVRKSKGVWYLNGEPWDGKAKVIKY